MDLALVNFVSGLKCMQAASDRYTILYFAEFITLNE
jgi:hypothetical protein